MESLCGKLLIGINTNPFPVLLREHTVLRTTDPRTFNIAMIAG